MVGTDGCTNLQLGHNGEDMESMTRRWQLAQGTATMWPPPFRLLVSSATAATTELALTLKMDGVVEMLSSRFRLPCCSLLDDLGITQLFFMVFLFR
jgi:hypothetical protein